MHLKKVKLLNFKNYTDVAFTLEAGINCILGVNGSGKTNLLDAIHYLSMTKSAFSSTDTQSIRHEESFFSIIASMEDSEGNHDMFCSLKKGSKKILRFDNNEYEKLSNHIGRFPSVIIAPNDILLISGGDEMRRKFFDSIISQTDLAYLQDLISYNHNLKQRNSLLKYFRDNLMADQDLITPYDKILLEKGKRICARRQKFMHQFLPIFKEKYNFIANGVESVDLQYSSQFSIDNPSKELNIALTKDIELQRSTFGTHRDQWKFTLDDRDLKKFGSQGQQKSFLISLKTAQFDLIKKEKGFTPILLLDDIFDKLDDYRIHQLMLLIANEDHGQLFLTDARPERTKSILKSLNLKATMFQIENGKIVAEKK